MAQGAGVVSTIWLSVDERHVLDRVAHGQAKNAIARGMNVSEATVKRHLARVGMALGAGPDQAQVVYVAARCGALPFVRTGKIPARFNEDLAEVLDRIVLGKSNELIGRELYLSAFSVKSRVARMLLVLDAVNRPHAVLRGLECGALRLPDPAAGRLLRPVGPAGIRAGVTP